MATAQAVEVSELKRQLGLADEDLVRINKGFDEARGMLLKCFVQARTFGIKAHALLCA